MQQQTNKSRCASPEEPAPTETVEADEDKSGHGTDAHTTELEIEWPSIWDYERWSIAKKKHTWLQAKKGKLGKLTSNQQTILKVCVHDTNTIVLLSCF